MKIKHQISSALFGYFLLNNLSDKAETGNKLKNEAKYVFF